MADSGRDIEEKNTARRATMLGLRYLDTRTLVRKPLYQDLIPPAVMREDRLTPIVLSEEALTVGITTTTPPDILDELRHIHNQRQVTYVLISNAALEEYIDLYDPPEQTVYRDIELSQTFDTAAAEELSRELARVKADDVLAYLVDQAFRLQASDIHCENDPERVVVRMRVHGTLYPIVELTKERYRILVGAVASAANVSTAARDAQSGHISQTHVMDDGREVVMNLRVETVPSINGMDIVMRFFSFDEEQLKLARLGLSERQIEIIDGIIKYPRGLVLVVGPTGSGKTTTLYSLVRELRSPQNKIITLEDPVEYQLDGVTQIPIDSQKGASFAKGLRAVLRLDPDIVMLGEIRDEDTIQTALQAALTGHLVMSTYHATSASLALFSIMQIVNRNPLFLSAIRLIQAQRLVRRLDDKTKEAYKPDEVELAQIKQALGTMDEERRPALGGDFKLYRPGSSDDNPFGFSGRIAIRELLVLDDEVKSYLMNEGKEANPSELEEYLLKNGKLQTILQEGIGRVIAGETTLEELYRAGA
ncbi:hypothetical protein F4X86_04555 [Candidatus Saccharibacteria bacterium]|nr:hypothetical protein [Candidatus Saccharibacteria bacterium]